MNTTSLDSRLRGNDNPIRRIVGSKSKTFLAFCFCFLAGIAFGSLINRRIDFLYFYLSLFIAVSLIIAFWKNKSVLLIVNCSLLIAGGFFRYSLALPPSGFTLPESEQKFTAYVSVEPDVRQDSVRYILEIRNWKLEIVDGVDGKVFVSSSLYPRYQYGDQLEITCRLERPETFEGFRYDMYLARLGVFALCRDPSMEKIGAGEGNSVLAKVLEFKNIVSERVNALWHEPYAGFMAGILYGYRGGLGSLTEQFNRTGVTHIIAISGYNITIVASILSSLLIYMWIPRKRAFWLITVGIASFVILTGASASVVRAGVMGLLTLLAKQLGRLNRVGNAMAFTAVLMTLHNPFVLVWDAGFQLSFLATLGIIYLPPLFADHTQKIPLPEGLKEIIVTTFAAILATLPLILFQFGRLSLVAPVVNVLILWIIPWVMLGGFASVILSFVFFPLGQVLSWTTLILMKYVTAVVSWFSSLPWSAVDVRLPWWGMVGTYVALVLWMRRKYRILRLNPAIAPPLEEKNKPEESCGERK